MPLFGSTETLFFSRASAAKSAACFRSCANSPLSTMSLPFGTEDFRQRSDVELLGRVDQRVCSLLWSVERLRPRRRQPCGCRRRRLLRCRTGPAWTDTPKPAQCRLRNWYSQMLISYQCSCLSASAAYRRPAASASAATEPPPPRDPMLEEPRLLLLRALDPLYPREPPPNASRLPPPLRETIPAADAIGSACTRATAETGATGRLPTPVPARTVAQAAAGCWPGSRPARRFACWALRSGVEQANHRARCPRTCPR